MLIDALRPELLPGLSNIAGPTGGRIAAWIAKGEYYVDAPTGPSSAELIAKPGDNLLPIFASEINRFLGASFETVSQINQVSQFPKSLGWLVIRSYYAAFYAAHGILRASGISCTQFTAGQTGTIEKISNALGFHNAPLPDGIYLCRVNASTQRLNCQQVPRAGKGGTHEQLWRVFAEWLNEVINRVLLSTSIPEQDAKEVASQLLALKSILTSEGQFRGNWLSTIRNRVNYAHEFDTWFPYGRHRNYCDKIFKLQRDWKSDPMKLSLASTDTLLRFLSGCTFLLSIGRALIEDMHTRSMNSDSYLRYGAGRLLGEVLKS